MTLLAHRRRCAVRSAAGRGVMLGVVAAGQLLIGCSTLRKPKVVPDSVATCRQLSCEGVAAMQRGQWAEAHALLSKAVAMSPGDVDARRQLAELLWQSGQPQEAAVHLEAAVRLDPQHAPTLVRSGDLLLAVGAVDNAFARAEAAVGLDPTLPSAWALRGRVHRQRGNLEQALADVHQALRRNPHDPALLQDAAELQYHLDRPQRCLTTLQHLLATTTPDGQPQRALWLAGLAYGKLNRHEEAATSLYAASLKGSPQPELLYDLAQAQSAAGHPRDAMVSVRQALAANGEHAPSRALLAQLEGAARPDAAATVMR